MKRILILSANPNDVSPLSLCEEALKIQKALKLAKKQDKFQVFTEWAVRIQDWSRELRYYEPEIVHFVGSRVGNQGLSLDIDNSGVTQFMANESLERLFDLCKRKIECVVLHGCYNEVQAEVIHKYINYVIGIDESIRSLNRIKLYSKFYTALGAGKSYEYSFFKAYNSLQENDISEHDLNLILKARSTYCEEISMAKFTAQNYN